FARPDADDSALRFLDSWRDFMGPKMRTVCGVLGSAVLYGGSGASEPRVSVACLEASYATGLGWSDATGEPSVDALVHGAADATPRAARRRAADVLPLRWGPDARSEQPRRIPAVQHPRRDHARIDSAASRVTFL